MGFWSTFADQLWSARTPIIFIAYLLVLALVRRTTHVERYHLRAVAGLLILHVAATAIAVGQQRLGYESNIAELCSMAFRLLAIVSLATTALIRTLLPLIGLTLPRILIDLTTAVGTIVVLIVVLGRAGFSVAGLITTSAVLTAVIGFSLQDTLGNVMAGMSVQLDKSLKVGDWISLGPNQPWGRVAEIRWRYTAIETTAWNTVIIPNGSLVKSQITILGRRAGQPLQTRRQVDFFVDFRTSPTEVLEVVLTALHKDPVANMAATPPAQVLFIGVRDSYVHYCVRYWLTDIPADDPTDSAIRIRVWFALRRANIPLSIPASTVFMTVDSPEREQRKSVEENSRRLAALESVDLFRAVPDSVRADLARELVYTPFSAGEAVTREGDNDDDLYMLVEGEAVVRIGHGRAGGAREDREVARLGPGQFFGEMSLMTGEARTASVIAATDLTCYRIGKPAFQNILRATPSIADQIADVLALRKSALDSARDEHEDAKRKRRETTKQDLLGRIRGFFGLSQAN